MIRSVAIVLAAATLPSVEGFAPSSAAVRISSSSRANVNYAGVRTAVCSEAMTTRRAVLAGILSLPLAGALPVNAEGNNLDRERYLLVSASL
jgi:hypothetical protein